MAVLLEALTFDVTDAPAASAFWATLLDREVRIESDGAFLVYSPTAAIVTNVEADHLDQWGTVEAYRAAFLQFLERIEPGGLLVLCADDPGAAALADPARERGLDVVTVGTGEAVAYRARGLRFEGTRSAFTVERDGGSHLCRTNGGFTARLQR